MLQNCHILYSTQSGRAKACARRVARIVSEHTNLNLSNGNGNSFDDEIVDIEEFAMSMKQDNNNNNHYSTTLLVLFVSTTGDGEHTDTIQHTWKQLLQKSLPSDLFQNVPFCIYSLGDRAYGPQFCAAGRKLAVRLLQLGAVLYEKCPPGYGDDGTPNGGVFRDLDQWIQESFLPVLPLKGGSSSLKEDDGAGNNGKKKLIPPYHVSVTGTTVELPSDSFQVWTQSSYLEFLKHQSPLTAYSYTCNDDNTEIVRNTNAEKNRTPLIANVTTNQRITANDWEQDTRHLEFQVTTLDNHVHNKNGTNDMNHDNAPPTDPSYPMYHWNLDSIPYQAGDVASIMPCNSPEEVNKFLKVLPPRLQEIADTQLVIEFQNENSTNQLTNNTFYPGVCYPFWPKECTLRGWLTYCADIHALPEREDLRTLSHYCAVDDHPLGKDQRGKLISLSETKEAALYADYVLREKRKWADVLYDFDCLRHEHSTLTIEALMAMLPPIRPRDYSIASSPSEDWIAKNLNKPGKNNNNNNNSSASFNLALCVAIVEESTPLGRSYHGLCTRFLSQLTPSSEKDNTGANHKSSVPVWIRPGSFQKMPLEVDNDTMNAPVLFVGSGTGVAPLRGLIREREAVTSLHTRSTESSVTNDDKKPFDRSNILIFGCRKQSADFYYENEWKDMETTGNLSLLTAFSRDQWHKIYVQQVIKKAEIENNFLVQFLVERNGCIYIAGGPKMARAVKEEIIEALEKQFEGGKNQAQQFLAKLQRSGRFAIEAWS